MSFYSLFILGITFSLSFFLTAKLVNSHFSSQLLDHPNERSLHTLPTPKTGGLAILGGIFIGLLLASNWNPKILWILSVTLFLGGISFLDVKSGLPQGIRLVCHALASLGIIWGAGLQIQMISIPVFGNISFGYFSIPITLLTLVWFANLYNFMDGMDGFASGMTVFGFGFLGLFGLIHNHQAFALQSLVIAVAAGGFLFFNWPPAKIFMGDAGSIPIGFLAGALTLQALNENLCTVWVPLLIFSPFIADATITLFCRFVSKKKFWIAHREHAYQRLVLAGWSHFKTVRLEYMLMLASGLSALIYGEIAPLAQLVLLAIWLAIHLTIAYFVRLFYVQK